VRRQPARLAGPKRTGASATCRLPEPTIQTRQVPRRQTREEATGTAKPGLGTCRVAWIRSQQSFYRRCATGAAKCVASGSETEGSETVKLIAGRGMSRRGACSHRTSGVRSNRRSVPGSPDRCSGTTTRHTRGSCRSPFEPRVHCAARLGRSVPSIGGVCEQS